MLNKFQNLFVWGQFNIDGKKNVFLCLIITGIVNINTN